MFHGTRATFDDFDPSLSDAPEGSAAFFTSDQATADVYANESRGDAEPRVTERQVDPSEFTVFDAGGRRYGEGFDPEQVLKDARADGVSGVVFQNVRNDYSQYDEIGRATGELPSHDIYAVFDEEKVSRGPETVAGTPPPETETERADRETSVEVTRAETDVDLEPTDAPITKADGTPFATRQSAMLSARNKRLEGVEPVQVSDGWALRRSGRSATREETTDEDVAETGRRAEPAIDERAESGDPAPAAAVPAPGVGGTAGPSREGRHPPSLTPLPKTRADVEVDGAKLQRQPPPTLAPESAKAWEELDALAKESPSNDEFRKSVTARHLTDLEDRGKHRFGRSVASRKDEADEFSTIPEVIEQHGLAAHLDDVGDYPELKRQIAAVARGKKTVKIYRGGLPEGADIEIGDFVTLDRSYVDLYEGHEGRGTRMVTKDVPVEDVVWGNADYTEWHYSPKDFREAVGTLEDFYDRQGVPDETKLQREQPAAKPADGKVRIKLQRRFSDQQGRVKGDIETIGRDVFGEGFGVQVAESITAPDGGAVPAAYDPANRVAYIALRADEAGMTASLYHEGLHHLRNMGAYDDADGNPNAAWKTLERQAVKDWRAKYEIDQRYEGDIAGMDAEQRERMMNEEAIAEALADYQTRGKETGFGPTVRAALDRVLNFFKRMASGLRGRGFKTWEDVFEGDIATGKAGKRADVKAMLDEAATPKALTDTVSPAETLLQRGKATPKANKDAFDQAAKDYTGVDLRGAADAVIKDKDRMGGFTEDVKAQWKGIESVKAPGVEVVDKPTQSDLAAWRRFFEPPSSWSRKFPKINALVKSGIQYEIDMSNRVQRLNKDWDKVTKKLSKDEYADLTGVMFLGDAEEATFTDAELAQMDISPKVKRAYRESRRFVDKLGRFTEQHRRNMALPLLKQRSDLVRKMAGSRNMDVGTFRRLFNERADLTRAQRDGTSDPETIGTEIDAITERVHGAAAPSEQYAAWAEEADRLQPRIDDTKIRKREGYVPHKFFGRWRIFEKVSTDQGGDSARVQRPTVQDREGGA